MTEFSQDYHAEQILDRIRRLTAAQTNRDGCQFTIGGTTVGVEFCQGRSNLSYQHPVQSTKWRLRFVEKYGRQGGKNQPVSLPQRRDGSFDYARAAAALVDSAINF